MAPFQDCCRREAPCPRENPLQSFRRSLLRLVALISPVIAYRLCGPLPPKLSAKSIFRNGRARAQPHWVRSLARLRLLRRNSLARCGAGTSTPKLMPWQEVGRLPPALHILFGRSESLIRLFAKSTAFSLQLRISSRNLFRGLLGLPWVTLRSPGHLPDPLT